MSAPAKMSREDVARLDRSLLRLRDAFQAIERVKAETKFYKEEADAVCAAYGITAEDLHSRAVVVNFQTGEIVRAEVKP